VRTGRRARRWVEWLERLSLGLAISGLGAGVTIAILPGSAGAASSIRSNKPYAEAQLLKLSDLPRGWTKSGGSWVGTSADDNSSSMFTMTQIPDFSTCLGQVPALSVTAAEAAGPDFFNKDGSLDVWNVADVYTSANDAKSDFPSFNNKKFAQCFLQVEGSDITSNDKSNWANGATLGTPIASVTHFHKYGDQSGLLEVRVPVTLPKGQGNSDDFFFALVIRQGRSVAELFMDQGVTTPSAALTESLAKALTAKMKAPPPGNTIIAA
jgi:hypothetical protein